MSFYDVYSPCMVCALPCAGIINRNFHANVDSRHVPRSFYSAAEPGLRPVVMFISTNPGGGGDKWLEPVGAYDHRSVTEIVNFQRGFVQGLFQRPLRQYHRTLRIMAQAYLNLPWPQFARHSVFTDLVKCTTPNDDLVPDETKITCTELHLSRELAAWNPVTVVALGDQAFEWINGDGVQLLGAIPLRRLPHPSRKGRGITDAWFRAQGEALRHEFNPDVLLNL